MSVLMNNSTNGLDKGLVVLRDVVAFGRPFARIYSLSRREQDGGHGGAPLRVVSKNIEEVIKE